MASSALPVVLITCASGTTGRELVKQLSATGKFKVRAGVRDLEKASKLFQGLSNVEIVKLDETDATATAAFTGLYGMYLIISEPHPSDPCFPTWFKHAKDANLHHFVFHSAITADIDDPVLLNRITFQQQEDVKATGAPYTILRPTFFHQNVEKMYYTTLPEGFFIGSSNGGKYTLVDVRDIASVAVKVFLEGKPHFGKSYPLTTEILTDEEMAKILSEGLGRKIEYMNLPAEAYAAELSKAGVTAPLIQAVIELEKEKDEGRTLPIQPNISQLLGRPGISFTQYVKDIAPTLQL